MRSPLVLITICAVLIASAARPLDGQIVRGQVVDSITLVPISGAAVVLLGADGSEVDRTATDEEGLFLLRPQVAGWHALRVEHDGYRTSTFPQFEVDLDAVGSFMLLVPSRTPTQQPVTLEHVAAQLCGDDALDPGRGILTGIVRHAATRTPVAGARLEATWPGLPDVLAAFVGGGNVGRFQGEVLSDTEGVYVACAILTRTPVVLHAASEDLLSDFVELRFDSGGVFVNGKFQPTDQNLWRYDFELATPDQRIATVTGIVLHGSTMQPLVGVTVEVLETLDQTTTDARGTFRISGLPAGPMRVAARYPGFRTVILPVMLQHDKTAIVPPGQFNLQTLPVELAPIVVEAERAGTRRPLTTFRERRARGGGSFITREEFEKQGNPQIPTDVLRRMRGIRLQANNNYGKPLCNVDLSRSCLQTDLRRLVLSTRRGGGRASGVRGSTECPPLLFIDRLFIGDALTIDIDHALPLEHIEAVEVYGSAATTPLELSRKGSTCGAIVFWTR